MLGLILAWKIKSVAKIWPLVISQMKALLMEMSAKVLDDGDVNQSDADKFCDSVRELFQTTYGNCVKWLSLNDPFCKGSSLIRYLKSGNIFL